ncbi:HlyD family efflux transporter periplasmic adaptor subunit [Moorellaceae bacterium AZ2]
MAARLPTKDPRGKRRALKKSLVRGLFWGGLFLFLLYQGVSRLLLVIAWQALQTQQVASGVLEKTISLETVVVREETFLAAPADGTLIRVIPEGERVAAGGTIAQVQVAAVAVGDAGVRDLKAPFAGQVCYHPDGLERVLQPGLLEQLDPPEVFSLARRARPAGEGSAVKAGTPVVRLVNNLQPLFLYTILPKVPSGWQEKKRVTLRSPDQAETVSARVERLYPLEDRYVLVLRIDKWGSRWLHGRATTVEAVVEKYSGVLVPRTAVVTLEDGSTGVYRLVGREVKFQQVEVVGVVDERAAVQGLKEGSEVVVNPYWVRFLKGKS